MARVKFGFQDLSYDLPNLTHYARSSRNESILIFDGKENDEKTKMVFAIGKVTFVQKGDKLDLVRMKFGRQFSRKIIVMDNHARRQLITLKRGQIAQMYGTMRVYQENGMTKVLFFAYGFLAWYVPKVIDIKNYDTEELEELEKENEESMLNFLDDILKGENE